MSTECNANTTEQNNNNNQQQEQEQECHLSHYANRTTRPQSGGSDINNLSEMSMSLETLGTFDPYSLYPYTKENNNKEQQNGAANNQRSNKNNRSRSRLDDYNNSCFDSMQMSLASLQMDNAD